MYRILLMGVSLLAATLTFGAQAANAGTTNSGAMVLAQASDVYMITGSYGPLDRLLLVLILLMSLLIACLLVMLRANLEKPEEGGTTGS